MSRCRSGLCEARHWDHLSHFAVVLGCGGEMELVFCSVGTPQAQAVQLQDAFEVSEEHLDLLSLAARDEICIGRGDFARQIARCSSRIILTSGEVTSVGVTSDQ